MSRLLVLGLILVALASPFCARATSIQAPPAPSHAYLQVAYSDIPMFDTEGAAQRHCPRDTVVWLNTRSGIYHLKGERWYGITEYGAYVCQKEADGAGYRETRNGQ